MAVEEWRGGRDLLGALLDETLQIACRTRDLLGEGAPRASDPLPVLAELERAARIGRIATRVSACMAWLLARRAVAVGELTPEQARREDWRLLRLEGAFWEEEPEAGEEAALAGLVRRAEQLYARVQRLDRGLDRDGAPAIVGPDQEA